VFGANLTRNPESDGKALSMIVVRIREEDGNGLLFNAEAMAEV